MKRSPMANKLNIQYTSYDLKNLIADRGWILERDGWQTWHLLPPVIARKDRYA